MSWYASAGLTPFWEKPVQAGEGNQDEKIDEILKEIEELEENTGEEEKSGLREFGWKGEIRREKVVLGDGFYSTWERKREWERRREEGRRELEKRKVRDRRRRKRHWICWGGRSTE